MHLIQLYKGVLYLGIPHNRDYVSEFSCETMDSTNLEIFFVNF